MVLAVTPLTYNDVKTFLQGLLTANGTKLESFPTFSEGPYILELPNQICTITLVSGGGYLMEGASDTPQFQVRIRSDQGAPGTSDVQTVVAANAALLDKLIFQAQYPTKLASGMNLLLASRVGGAPAPLGLPDATYRFDYTCSYYAVIGVSNVG
jgi:hypothetical protein